MNRITTLLLVVVVGLAGVSARANTFLLSGQLDDGAAAASGLFTFTFSIQDADGATIWTERQTNVVVVGGAFAVDVGALELLPDNVSAAATLQVTVDDDALPAFPLAALIRADRAAVAQTATTSPTTSTLAGLTASEVVRKSALAAAGGPGVPFGSVTGVPADVADGDQGVVVNSAGNGLVQAGGDISIAGSVDANRFAAGAIAGSRFASNTIDNTKVATGAVTGAKVGADLTRADLTADVGQAQVAGTPLFRVPSGCQESENSLTTRSTCRPAGCTQGILSGVLNCSGGCVVTVPFPSSCPNSPVGTLVAQ